MQPPHRFLLRRPLRRIELLVAGVLALNLVALALLAWGHFALRREMATLIYEQTFKKSGADSDFLRRQAQVLEYQLDRMDCRLSRAVDAQSNFIAINPCDVGADPRLEPAGGPKAAR